MNKKETISDDTIFVAVATKTERDQAIYLLLCKGLDPVGTLRFSDINSLSLLLRIGEFAHG